MIIIIISGVPALQHSAAHHLLTQVVCATIGTRLHGTDCNALLYSATAQIMQSRTAVY
jgi:hypothetical protein